MSSSPCGCDADINHVCDGCTIAALREVIVNAGARIKMLEDAISFAIFQDDPYSGSCMNSDSMDRLRAALDCPPL